jgi:hypothetical protein
MIARRREWESRCSFLGHVVVERVATVKPGGRAVAAGDEGCEGNLCRCPRRTMGVVVTRGLSPYGGVWGGALGGMDPRTRDLYGVCTWSSHGCGPLLWLRPLRSSDAAAVGQLMLRDSARVSSTHQRKESPVVSSPAGAGLGRLARSRVR